MKCPACLSAQCEELSTVATAEISRLYQRLLRVDVRTYFREVPNLTLQRCRECDLRFYLPFCPGDGAFYKSLEVNEWYYDPDKPEFAYAYPLIPAGSSVLDVGCGWGAFGARLPDTTDYLGLELNDQAIAEGRRRGLTLRKESIEQHAARAPSSHDVVCAFQVMEHIPEVRSFVHSCITALKPGGKLILTVPSEDSFVGIALDNVLNMPPHHVLRWTDHALRQLAAREGLSMVEIWHEPLAEMHREWHTYVMARHYAASLGVDTQNIIGNGLRYKALGKLMRVAPIREAMAHAGRRRFAHAGRGHTVAMVARRPGCTAERAAGL